MKVPKRDEPRRLFLKKEFTVDQFPKIYEPRKKILEEIIIK